MDTPTRKFYRNVITIEVLTQDAPIPSHMHLEEIEREYTYGDWSASGAFITSEEVDPTTMARLLAEQGSSPEFFGLSEEL